MTNLRDGVPILGEFQLLPDTYYSIELLVKHFVPERNATSSFPLEEDVTWNSAPQSSSRNGAGSSWTWAFARQERFHLVAGAPFSASYTEIASTVGGFHLHRDL